MKSDKKIAYLGLGSNLGDRKKNLEIAHEKLSQHPNIRITASSSFYETEPVGYLDQDWFINQAIEIETSLSPIKLLETTQGIEEGLGRERSIKWGPRTVDIDILAYEDRIMNTPVLKLPHPSLHERRFVLVPLEEIAPAFLHPVLDKSISKILIDTPDKNLVKRI